MSDRWWTPLFLLALVRVVLNGVIHLDPFSEYRANKHRVKALKYYHKYNSGFKETNEWCGRGDGGECVPWNIYANPPGGVNERGESQMGQAFQRALHEYKSGHVLGAVLLLKSAVGYVWFKEVLQWPVCFLHERPSFLNPERPDISTPTMHGYCVVYIGPEVELFAQTFSQVGSIPGYNSWSFRAT